MRTSFRWAVCSSKCRTGIWKSSATPAKRSPRLSSDTALLAENCQRSFTVWSTTVISCFDIRSFCVLTILCLLICCVSRIQSHSQHVILIHLRSISLHCNIDLDYLIRTPTRWANVRAIESLINRCLSSAGRCTILWKTKKTLRVPDQ